MQLEISILQKEGAYARNITEKIVIKDLKEWVHKNSQGQYEILFDTERLLTIGSMNAVGNSTVVYTQYSVSFNQYKIYEEAFNTCLAEYNCSQNLIDEAKIRNDIHKNIWSNTSTTD